MRRHLAYWVLFSAPQQHWVDAKLDKGLEAGVAQIALAVVQSRLPQCAFVSDEGVTLSREPFGRPSRAILLLPQHLCTINWADTGPGISWPEAYHAIYFPQFDRYVVTESQDSDDLWGVTDMAIGHFPGNQPLLEGARQVIVDWWRYLREEGSQEHWAYVWQDGLVDAATAETWAEDVWPVEPPEDDPGEDSIDA